MDLNYTPLLAVIVSGTLAFFTYLNYRLNKTLNIKNQLHNEKVKIYRELIRIIADMIAIMDRGAKVLSDHANEKESGLLHQLADEIDHKGKILHHLIIESYMVVPDHIAELLADFSDFFHSECTAATLKEYLRQSAEVDIKTREMANGLVEAFRKDLGTSKLNYKLGRN